MMKRLFFLPLILLLATIAACTDDDSFTTNRSNVLSFSTDTVSLDTVFSTVPTSTHTFWVYNNSGDGLRLSNVRLQRGNQSGYRVNVDGTYLDNTMGSQVGGLEVRKGDSLRVFVELTSHLNSADEPQLVEDNIVFTLESGVEQKVNLRAFSWDADIRGNIVVSRDTTITASRPLLVYGGITVDSSATLTINAPAKLYFRSGAGIDVYGRLLVNGTAANEVVLRGERTDRMFDYLPYDRVSGQWKGIRLRSSSTGNSIVHADIHSSEYGIQCDSAAYDSINERFSLRYVTIHNCKGAGISAHNANFSMVNCQITNTLGDCLAVYGGSALVVYCTLGQFYPFSADRGVALRFANFKDDYSVPLRMFECYNTIVTGYAEDEVMGEVKDSTVAYGYYFSNCILRTPLIADSTQLAVFQNVTMETPKDSVEGKKHFAVIDEDNLYYDFRLDSLSTARGQALQLWQFADDRNGKARGDKPDIGCYQY